MRVERLSPTVFTPLEDGTGVLLNLETLSYFSLNRSAVAVWQELEKNSSSTLDDLVLATCERFDIDQDSARREVRAFVERLEQFKMVHVE